MRTFYWLFAYLGVMTPTAAFIYGFRYDPGAPKANYLFNAALFAGFITIHLVMTRPWFKRATTGRPQGSLRERQVYVSTSIITWVLLLVFHKPVPGPGFVVPEWIQFLGLCAMLVCVFGLFEFANFRVMNGLLGVPGSAMSHSHGTETPLLTEGSYGAVRHPMYRAFILIGMTSLIVHPHAAQLMWALFLGVTFVAFIPVEESQLLRARGDAYRAYMEQTPYRIFPGVW